MDSTTPATGPAPVGKLAPMNLEKLIDRYVALRDRKREVEKRHKEELKPFRTVMDEIEAMLMQYMQKSGIDHVATPGGTAYQVTKPSATIRDGSAFRQWVVKNERYDIVDWRANARAVFEYIRENEGKVPPGINASTYTTVNFRRPGEEE